MSGKSKKSSIGPLVTKDKIITEDTEKAEVMNNFFANVGKELAMTVGEPNKEQNLYSHIYKVSPTINTIDNNYELLEKSFKQAVKTGKATGPDNISALDLKLNENASIRGLYHVLDVSIKSGKFPTS